MKRFIIITVLAILAVVIALTLFDTIQSHYFVTGVKSIKAGESKEEVVAALGRATEVFTPPQKIPSGMYLGVRVETWAYGKHFFDWQHCFYSQFPYFYPLQFRLFGPSDDDVKIEFDSTGRVSRILTPTK